MCYHCYYLFHHSLNWSFFVLSISRVQTMHLGHQSLKSIILFIGQEPFWGFAQIPCASDTFFMSSTILLFSVPSAPTTTGIATVFICHILFISCLGTCTCFSSPFLSERCFSGIPCICNYDIWYVRCYGSVSIDRHVPYDGDVVVFIVHHSLWLMLVPFVCSLDIMILTDAPMELES